MATKVRVTASRGLNVREGPGTQYRRVSALPFGTVVTVLQRSGVWGKIQTPAGWIHLGYTEPVEDEPPADGFWLDGEEAIDLSLWNKLAPDFWRGAKPWALILKATQGLTILDPRFGERWARARFQAWSVWAYHFYDPSYPGYAQAGKFLRVTGLQDGERAALDLEWYPPEGKQAWAAREVREWIRAVEDVTGKPPVIYTRRDVWVAFFGEDGDADISQRCPLVWVADYREGVTMPLSVPGWDKPAMWQYTCTARWPGVAGNVDRSKIARWFAEQEG